MGVKASKLSQKSLNFLRTGVYDRLNGGINGRVSGGNWWSSATGPGMNGHHLGTAPTDIGSQRNNYRGHGFAVRCVVREG